MSSTRGRGMQRQWPPLDQNEPMTLRHVRSAVFVTALAFASGPVRASTGGPTNDWSLNEYGGFAADRQVAPAGTPGVLLASSPASLLFLGWRGLHGLSVSPGAAAALAVPCCGKFSYEPAEAVTAWLDGRKVVTGTAPLDDGIPTERPGPDHTSIPNCMDDAFRTAARTLTDRVKTHASEPGDVRFWLQAQDIVFQACSKPGAALPPLPDAAPDWLRADYRYQSAALAFYSADYPAAADAFAVIAQDTASPWKDIAPYVRARALLRQALASNTQADFVAARQAAGAIPAGATMHEAAARLADMAQVRGDPAAAATRLGAALADPTITAQAASDFKDLQALDRSVAPELLDWISTFKTGAAAPPEMPDYAATALEQAKAVDRRRVAALAHAGERYAAAHDVAWLLAVLALTQPDDAAASAAIADAAALEPNAPAYLTALYHRIRLTIATADRAATRAVLDTVLARTDLTGTTRNLFLAERMQVAASLSEIARNAMRARICATDAAGCKSEDWGYYGTGNGLFDGDRETATTGLGDDARYIIDRMALASRMVLGSHAALPTPIRLDIALTNFARAVLLRDTANVDVLCVQLQTLLRVMAAEFAAIPKAARGTDRQFAEYLVFAKIPGPRTDLLDYVRPTGAVADFTGYWPNWVVLAQPDPTSIPPAPVLYDNANYQVIDVPAGTDLGDGHVRIPDVVCKGLCGAGGFIPRPMPFLSGTAARAVAERRLLPPPGRFEDPATYSPNRRAAFPVLTEGRPERTAIPASATCVWEFILSYAETHPRDPRVPEALHWLIHVGHYGQGNNHSGKRAFLLLKSRYPASPWSRANTFYFD